MIMPAAPFTTAEGEEPGHMMLLRGDVSMRSSGACLEATNPPRTFETGRTSLSCDGRGTRITRAAGTSLLDEHHAADRRSALRLAFGAMRPCRKLQHCGVLPGAETGQQHHLAVRKFQRVVMVVRIVEVDLLEASDLLTQLLVGAEAERVLAFAIAVEHKLGPRKETDRDAGLTDG